MILVRHAQVVQTPGIAASRWPLSDVGRRAAAALAEDTAWREVGRIFTSPEAKAVETARVIGTRWTLDITVVDALREVERPDGQWFGDEYPGGYPAAVAAYYATPLLATHGWEPPAVARARMTACIGTLRHVERRPFAIVGHGLSLSLYLAAVTGADPAALWPGIGLPDRAVLDDQSGKLVAPFGEWVTQITSP